MVHLFTEFFIPHISSLWEGPLPYLNAPEIVKLLLQPKHLWKGEVKDEAGNIDWGETGKDLECKSKESEFYPKEQEA